MDISLFEVIQQYLEMSIVLVCLFVGYILKSVVSNKTVHTFIPLIVGILGIVAAIWVDASAGLPITLDTFTTGLASGLASTGMYELFHQLITKLPEVRQEQIDLEVAEDFATDEYAAEEDQSEEVKGGKHFADD